MVYDHNFHSTKTAAPAASRKRKLRRDNAFVVFDERLNEREFALFRAAYFCHPMHPLIRHIFVCFLLDPTWSISVMDGQNGATGGAVGKTRPSKTRERLKKDAQKIALKSDERKETGRDAPG